MVINSTFHTTPRKILIICCEPELCPEIKKAIGALALEGGCTWQVLAVGYLPYIRLCEEGVTGRYYDSYFVEEDHYSDYHQAIGIATRWFLDAQGNDDTMYHGVSLGVIVQRLMIQFFNNFLSQVRTVTRILQEERPDELWLCISSTKRGWSSTEEGNFILELFSTLAYANHITCREKIVYGKVPAVKVYHKVQHFAQRCKLLIYSLIVSRLLFFIKYPIRLRKRNGNVNILLPTPQSLNYIGKIFITRLLSDRRKNVLIWKGNTRWQQTNLIDIPSPLFPTPTHHSKDIISTVKKRFGAFVTSSVVKEFKATEHFLAHLYERQIDPLMVDTINDIEHLEAFFKRIKTHLVFSHSDTTLKERTAISIAHRHGISSIVLQHGSAGHYWGFFPFIATTFAAWGEITEGWFRKNGVPQQKIAVTGAASFEAYVHRVNNNRGFEKAEWNGLSDYFLYVTVKGKKCATGFKHTEYDNVLILNALLDVLHTMPEKILVIKLRPGDSQTAFYESEIKRRGLSNVHLVEVTDNGDLLNACALLITTYSTMAIEALIFEKPVVQLRFVNKKRLMNALARQGILCDEDVIPLAKYGAALGVDSPEKLKEAIRKISEDEEVRTLLIAQGKVFLEKYGYVKDGKATKRMIECIETMLERTA